MNTLRLVTLAPGHFHAALIQKEMYPNMDARVQIYAPLDADLLTHLQRIRGFNSRKENPTSWELEIHAGDSFLDRFRKDHRGNLVVLAGKNHRKLDLMIAAIEAGCHVLADKPWIIEVEQFSKLEALLEFAQTKGLLLYDMMTERFEITSIFQRELVRNQAIFGQIQLGDKNHPAVRMKSVHYLKKEVSGLPLRRPWWFFDIYQEGEALSDVGTHLVDLVKWILFTDNPIHYREIIIHDAHRWPTILSREQFTAITGLPDFPSELHPWIEGDHFSYFCNTKIVYEIRGTFIELEVLWDYEASHSGGDKHEASFSGANSTIEIRQTDGEAPRLFVIPQKQDRTSMELKLNQIIGESLYPMVKILPHDTKWEVVFPNRLRVGHEAHFGEVTRSFLGILESPNRLPQWEKSHLLAKYYLTTQGVTQSRVREGKILPKG
jgi:predicted dehydrogenase